MAVLVLLALILAMTDGSGATWCVCKPDASDASLQKTLDYACGAGADCTPIMQNGVCYLPNTVKAHCNYAANSYFQKKGQGQGTCDFAGTATISTTDPSPSSSCVFASNSSSTAGTTPTPTSGTPNTGINNPSSTPIVGGTTISPTGLTNDFGGGSYPKAEMGLLFLAFWLSSLALWRG